MSFRRLVGEISKISRKIEDNGSVTENELYQRENLNIQIGQQSLRAIRAPEKKRHFEILVTSLILGSSFL